MGSTGQVTPTATRTVVLSFTRTGLRDFTEDHGDTAGTGAMTAGSSN